MAYKMTEDFKANPWQTNQFERATGLMKQISAMITTKEATEMLNNAFAEADIPKMEADMKRLQDKSDVAAGKEDEVERLREVVHLAGNGATDPQKRELMEAVKEAQAYQFTPNQTQRMNALQLRINASKKEAKEQARKAAEIYTWIDERVDSRMKGKLSTIQGDSTMTPATKIREMVKIVREEGKGDQKMIRYDIKKRLEKLEQAESMADVRERVATVEHFRSMIQESIQCHGGNNTMDDEEYIRIINDTISEKSQSLVPMRAYLIIETNQNRAMTWNEFERKVTDYLNREQRDGKDNKNATMFNGSSRDTKKEREKEGEGAAVYTATAKGAGGWKGSKAECFQFKNNGKCEYGAGCRFLHNGRKATKDDQSSSSTRRDRYEPRGDRSRSRDRSPSKGRDGNRDRRDNRESRSRSRDQDRRKARDGGSDSDSGASEASARIPAGTLRQYKAKK